MYASLLNCIFSKNSQMATFLMFMFLARMNYALKASLVLVVLVAVFVLTGVLLET